MTLSGGSFLFIKKDMSFIFDYNTKFYSNKNAYWLARASRLVYTRVEENNPAPDTEVITKTLQTWDKDFTEVTTFDHKSTQAFIAKHKGFVLIAFRGTDEIIDWRDNLNPLAREGIHVGFHNAFLDVWEKRGRIDRKDKMVELLSREDYRNLPIWVTGHSLGGALASICAYTLIKNGMPFYGLYTFGEPPAFRGRAAERFNEAVNYKYFRFQNQNDIVSKIPQPLVNYCHAGTQVYIDAKDNVIIEPSAWFKLWDSVKGFFEFVFSLGKGGVARDHGISEYIAILKKGLCSDPDWL